MNKAIDLFAGAGGLSYGFLLTGEFEFVAAAEINENARATYKHNIVEYSKDFEFIKNVNGYDFSALNKKIEDKIDVVIGGPPCQGFSNANRQKNHLISMNNGLVKEFFRAIKQINPRVFVMENVSMLKSNTHRFYDTYKDKDEIDKLILQGAKIPKRTDYLILTTRLFEGIDLKRLPDTDLSLYTIPKQLNHLLSVLKKNLKNERRLSNFIKKNSTSIKQQILGYLKDTDDTLNIETTIIRNKLTLILAGLENKEIEHIVEALDFIVDLQKLVQFIKEIQENELIGYYEYSQESGLTFVTESYSVIDYIGAILGDRYIQKDRVFNAEWFGVPQERRRFIVMGIRSDVYDEVGEELDLSKITQTIPIPTVGDAIMDLAKYEVGYSRDYVVQPYKQNEIISDYALMMRQHSEGVKNHITTKTTEKALERFKKIKPGKNFHSLDVEDKDTYSKPERTQNTIYLRLDPNKPCGTVVNVRKSMWIHPTLNRAISVREAARLQSFPDNFEFIGTKDSQYQQVGNAVPPLLAKGIAEIILRYL